jgi:hypothetical protein
MKSKIRRLANTDAARKCRPQATREAVFALPFEKADPGLNRLFGISINVPATNPA